MGRKQKFGTVLIGVLSAVLFGVTGYLAGSAVGHLGLFGHPLGMRVTRCAEKAGSTPRGGGTPETHYDCSGVVISDGRTRQITVDGFSSYPLTHVQVAREPWGGWVPVDHGTWNRLGRALSPLVPLALALLLAKGTLIGYRGWRNSRRLPTGSSE